MTGPVRPASELGNRRAGSAHWALIGREIFWGRIFGERDVRDAQIDDRFQAIADFSSRHDMCTGRFKNRLGVLKRLTGVPDVISNQDTLAGDDRSIDGPKRELTLRGDRERGKARGRVTQLPAGIEKTGERVRQQRSAHHRPGHNFDGIYEVVREDLNQVLRQPPDERRLPEDPVRIEVRAAMIPIAVVEVSVAHQHFKLSEIVEGLAA